MLIYGGNYFAVYVSNYSVHLKLGRERRKNWNTFLGTKKAREREEKGTSEVWVVLGPGENWSFGTNLWCLETPQAARDRGQDGSSPVGEGVLQYPPSSTDSNWQLTSRLPGLRQKPGKLACRLDPGLTQKQVPASRMGCWAAPVQGEQGSSNRVPQEGCPGSATSKEPSGPPSCSIKGFSPWSQGNLYSLINPQSTFSMRQKSPWT